MNIRRLEGSPFGVDWSALSELERLRRELGRLVGSYEDTGARIVATGVFPLMNVSENTEDFYVRSELPGMELKDIDLSVTGNSLSISGERMIAAEGANVKYLRREREAGSFRRVLHLPTEVDPGKVEAKYSHGVLTVRLPKAEKAKPKQISIKAT